MATTKDKFGRMLTGQITQLYKMSTTSNYLVGSESQAKTTTIKDRFRQLRTSIGQIAHSNKMFPISNSLLGLKSKSDRRTDNIVAKARRFRVLVIGRANAGKTTILQKVCNTSEQPDIFDGKGNKVRRHSAQDLPQTLINH